jgi:hypothetical protein
MAALVYGRKGATFMLENLSKTDLAGLPIDGELSASIIDGRIKAFRYSGNLVTHYDMDLFSDIDKRGVRKR